MYLTFDLLEPATLLAIEFIDAVCGHGKEYFGLKVIKTLMIMGVNFLRWVIFSLCRCTHSCTMQSNLLQLHVHKKNPKIGYYIVHFEIMMSM